jgi:hypothetical protein
MTRGVRWLVVRVKAKAEATQPMDWWAFFAERRTRFVMASDLASTVKAAVNDEIRRRTKAIRSHRRRELVQRSLLAGAKTALAGGALGLFRPDR